MSNLQCHTCHSQMILQSESLTEEFWVCSNSKCNKWLRRSSITQQITSNNASNRLSEAIYSLFNKRVFNSPALKMMFDAEK